MKDIEYVFNNLLYQTPPRTKVLEVFLQPSHLPDVLVFTYTLFCFPSLRGSLLYRILSDSWDSIPSFAIHILLWVETEEVSEWLRVPLPISHGCCRSLLSGLVGCLVFYISWWTLDRIPITASGGRWDGSATCKGLSSLFLRHCSPWHVTSSSMYLLLAYLGASEANWAWSFSRLVLQVWPQVTDACISIGTITDLMSMSLVGNVEKEVGCLFLLIADCAVVL